jgi:DNA-3-methyladenine glycosylase II
MRPGEFVKPRGRVFEIEPQRPYSLELTAERLGRFSDGIDHFDGSRFRRLIFCGASPLLLCVSQGGSPAKARLRVRLHGRGAERVESVEVARAALARMLGTEQDLRSFYRALRDDSILGPSIRRFRGLRVAGAASLFEALVTAILSQQINLAFAYSIRAELAMRFGRRARIDGSTYLAFPTPQRLAKLTPEQLRALRLSGAKARAIHALAEGFRSGALRESALERLSDEEVVARLVALPGIGRWTAEIGLLRGLGRPDVFPAADLAVLKFLARAREAGSRGRDAGVLAALAPVAQSGAGLCLCRDGASGRLSLPAPGPTTHALGHDSS